MHSGRSKKRRVNCTSTGHSMFRPDKHSRHKILCSLMSDAHTTWILYLLSERCHSSHWEEPSHYVADAKVLPMPVLTWWQLPKSERRLFGRNPNGAWQGLLQKAMTPCSTTFLQFWCLNEPSQCYPPKIRLISKGIRWMVFTVIYSLLQCCTVYYSVLQCFTEIVYCVNWPKGFKSWRIG